MKNIQKVGTRNHLDINAAVRRYNLSDMLSESYNLLFDCTAGSRLYKLVECHINNVRENPLFLESLSRDLAILKGLHKLGESAVIKESDIPDDTEEFEDEMDLDEEDLGSDNDVDELDGEDVINEEEDVIPDEEEEVLEESEEDEEEVLEESEEEEVIEETETPEEELTPEELQELKKHLREMRRARKVSEAKQVKAVKESRSWAAEKSSMKAALKHFTESSKSKAFYRTFSKMSDRLNSKAPLTLSESILLYKAANSAMTQLTVELEHNPGFIYTFKECTNILSQDTSSLLECIKGHETPSQSLVESLRDFSQILLESEEDFDDDYEEETTVVEQEDTADSEEVIEETEEEEVPVVETPVEEQEEVVDTEEPAPAEEVEESEEVAEEEEEIPVVEESDEITPEETSEEEIEAPTEELEEDDFEDDSEITEDEAEELRKKLEEIRHNKRSQK